MADDALEKEHQATAKRLADLRLKGQTLRSRDLTSGLVFVAGIIMLFFMADHIKTRFQTNFISSFYKIRDVLSYDEMPFEFIKDMVLNNIYMVLPIFLVSVAIAFISPFIFGGWNFSLQAIQFKGEKLNPIANLKGLFSKRMFTNVAKSFFKVLIIMSVLVMYEYDKSLEIIKLMNFSVYASLHQSYSIISTFIIVVSTSLVLIILFDVIVTYFEYQSKTKMTTQELKDESKDTEGSADIKRRVRSAQIALFKQRLSVTVPKATVVITNPTHYAIAIRYDVNKDKAPKVVAKGKDYIAQQIRRIAVKNGVTIYEAPLLARAIYKTSNIGAEIQPELYMAVAIVLSYVHQLKNYQQGLGQMPQIVDDLQIPEGFIYHE